MGEVGKNYEEWLTMAKVEVNLNGGVIAGNKARSSGGGIYIATNFVNFNKTMLLDNKADQFGGGFYVSFPPYIQQLKNLLVTENSVSGHVDKLGGGNGGGLWNCPTGYVHIGDGHTVYIYNNKSDGSGADLAFVEKTHKYDLHQGGSSINIGGKFYSHVSPVTEGYKDGKVLELIKFLNDDRSTGQGPIPEHMSYADDWMYLKALYSEKLQKEAWTNAKTFILGNKARNGGGIGSNANMETPEDKGTYDLELKKRWIGVEKKNQSSVKVDIFIVPEGTSEADVRENYGTNDNYYKYGEVELNSLNNWTRRFSQSKYAQYDDLPAHLKDHGLPFSQAELAERGYQYLVIERNPRGFVYTVEEVVPKEANRVNETVGIMQLERYLSQIHPRLDKAIEADALLYVERENGKFEKIGKGMLIQQEDRYHTEMTHPLLAQVVGQEYYGKDRLFTEFSKEWSEVVNGHHVSNSGYAFYLKRNPEGEGYILQIPYLWIQDYDKKVGDSGFRATIRKENKEYQPGPDDPVHQFILSNRRGIDIRVEKYWHEDIAEKDRPDQIKVYLLYKGKKVIKKDYYGNDKFDEKGNPIYRYVLLRKKDKWKGKFTNLPVKDVVEGLYTIKEEESKEYRAWIERKQSAGYDHRYSFRIGYVDNYDEPRGSVSTAHHFHTFMGDIDLNLYVDGELHETQKFKWQDLSDENGPSFNLLKNPLFGEDLYLNNYGQPIQIDYYDPVGEEPGLTSYDFHIKRGPDGYYRLYVPRLMINGVPYHLFRIMSPEYFKEIYDYRDYSDIPSSVYPGFQAKHTWKLTNLPTIDIQVEKKWLGGESVEKPKLEFILKQDGIEIGKIQMNQGATQAAWEGLDKYYLYQDKDGNDQLGTYVYTVEEVFESDVFKQASVVKDGENKYIFTNAYIIPKTKIAVEKVWSGGPAVKPTIQLQLMRNGEAYGEIVELMNGTTSYQWTDLDKTDQEGKEYIYTVQELTVDGYTSTVGPVESGKVQITNTYIVPKTEIAVEKVWSGGPAVKPTIQLQLMRNGEAYGEIVELMNGTTSY
ncbi:Cna B-type domain-containing protein, partial [Facklamia languida]